MKKRFALILFYLIIVLLDTVVHVYLALSVVFNTQRATEIILAYDRVGNATMGQGNETISSWSGRHNSWMEKPINKLFYWLNGEENHCDNNREV